MFRCRSDILHPLISATSDKITKFVWTDEMTTSFEEIKQIIAQQVLLAFPDFKSLFYIYTDTSDYQLGAVIMQHGKPLAFFSHKLTNS